MAMKTLKSVGSRTPQNINIELDTLPENESDALCRTIISGMSRAFEDPAVMADYQNWKKTETTKKGGSSSMKYMGSKAKVAATSCRSFRNRSSAPAMRPISSHSAAAAM